MSYGAILLDDVMIDILSRLPAKSLCRFKCVSKPWYALISSANFAKSHLNQSSNNKCERAFLISGSLYYSIDCTEASNNDTVIATKIEHPDLFNYILASCNGLLLVRDEEGTNFLLNPSTRESKKLPSFLFVSARYCTFGFGYDSSSDNYKVVAVSYNFKTSDSDSDSDWYSDYDYDYDYDWNSDYDYADDNGDNKSYSPYPEKSEYFLSVYSLKTNSWERIQDFPYDHSPLMPNSGVFVNGSIHWLTYKCSDKSPVIAAFDVADEKFRDISAPSSLENGQPSRDLGVLGGCLCTLGYVSDTKADIWVMNEYGMAESWTKFTISLPTTTMYDVVPLCLLLDREVLLKMGVDELVAYNAKEKSSRYIKVNDILVTFVAVMTYVESIVSPHYLHREKI